MDREAVLRAVTIDAERQQSLQAAWSTLIGLAVWGRLKSSRLGAGGRMRRRLLDTGEKLASLCATRTWIPHPREQLKNALGSALALRDSMNQLRAAASEIDGGGDAPRFAELVSTLEAELASWLPELENRWAELLDTQYHGAEDDDDES